MSYKPYSKYKDSGVEWIGRIPEHWEIKKFKHLYKSNMGATLLKTDLVKDGEVPVYSATESDIIFGYVNEASVMLEQGDLVIPARGNSIGFVTVVKGKATCTQTTIYSKRIRDDFNSGFIFQYLRGLKEILFQFDRTAIPQITVGEIKENPVVLPPIYEQTTIADFLDEKTAQIAKLIENKQKLIELLKEERIAIIKQSVTRGIDPNVKLKPSGIEWLGDIPEHWAVSKIYFISKVVRGAAPRPAGDPQYFNGDHTPWITVGEITKDDKKYLTEVEEYLTEEGANQSRFIPNGKLVLTNSGATLGVPKILKIGGCINDGSLAFFNLSERVEIHYLYYFFRSLTELYREQMSGYGQPNLNTDIVKGTRFCFPDRTEQIEIVNYLEKEINRIFNTISKIEKEIDLLQEYRTALISEVVTGKIKVV